MKGKIIREACTATGTIGFIIILMISFGIIPALGNFLNPFGIWTVPNNAEYHDMTITDSRLNDTVTVQFDEYGIPHIYAKTDHDLCFVIGYLHAFNRLFEMDLFRRAASGRLSEILGTDYIEDDMFFRILGFNRFANREIAYLQENKSQIYALLLSYANGVNKYIDTLIPVKMPIEYKLLSIFPEPWTPTDTALFQLLQAWILSGSTDDLDTTLLQEKLPPDVYTELYPDYSMGLLPFEEPIIQEYITLNEEEDSALVKTIKTLKILQQNHIHLFGISDLGLGSNNWAVNGSKSATGTPLLAGDPHLDFTQPSLWYEAHMVSDEGYNATGVTFPAAPVIVIGHNDKVAWSPTNVGGDTHVDYYEEMLNGTHYFYDGDWCPLETFEEVIAVKDSTDFIFTVRETVHGPLITDHSVVVDLIAKGFSPVNISLKWTGVNPDFEGNFSDLFTALYRMNKAVNFSTFNEGLQFWSAPAQNIVYADDEGNIAMTVVGLLPIRKQGVGGTPDGSLKGNIIQNGTGEGEEWAGFIPFNELTREVNPSRCWVSSTNQRSINATSNNITYPYYIGENTFANSFRSRRIKTLLESSNSLTLEDMAEFQMDIYDYSAQEFLPILLDVWNYSTDVLGDTYDPIVKAGMNELFIWNQSNQRYQFNKTWIAPTIYELWLRVFQSNVWDEFAAWDVSGLRKPPIEILENLTKYQPNSRWFDDNSTMTTEGRNYTMLKSFNVTIAYLQYIYGDITDWVWGDHHQIYVAHLTEISAFSSPRVPIDGYANTLNAQWGTGGPSWRMIIDLGDATTPLLSKGIYPGGQHGNPVSSHYLDLFNLYVENEYNNLYRSTLPTVEATWTFKP